MLGQGSLCFLQAERVERVTAHLAEHQLGTVNNGHMVRPGDKRTRHCKNYKNK